MVEIPSHGGSEAFGRYGAGRGAHGEPAHSEVDGAANATGRKAAALQYNSLSCRG